MSFVETRPCRFDLKNEFNEFHCDPDVGDWSKVKCKAKSVQPPKSVVTQGAINNPVHMRERKTAQLGANHDPELQIKAHVQHWQKWAPAQRNTHRDAAPGWCVIRDLGTEIAENKKNTGCGVQKSNYWAPGGTPINPTGQIQVGWWGKPARTMRPFYRGVKYSIYGRQPRTPWIGRNGFGRSHHLRGEPVKKNPKQVKRKVTRFQGLHGSSTGCPTFCKRGQPFQGQGSSEKTARTQLKFARPTSVNGTRMGARAGQSAPFNQPCGAGGLGPRRHASALLSQDNARAQAAPFNQPSGAGRLGPQRRASALLGQDRCQYSRARGFRPCGIKLTTQQAEKMQKPKGGVKMCPPKPATNEFIRVRDAKQSDRCLDTTGEFEDPAYAVHRMAQQQLFDEFGAMQTEGWMAKIMNENEKSPGGGPIVKGSRHHKQQWEKIDNTPKPRNVIPDNLVVEKPVSDKLEVDANGCVVSFDSDQVYTRRKIRPQDTIQSGLQPKLKTPNYQLFGRAVCRGHKPSARFSTKELPAPVCKLPQNGILPQRCQNQTDSFASGGQRAVTRKRVNAIERTFNERETGLPGTRRTLIEKPFVFGQARSKVGHDRVQYVQYLPEWHLKLDCEKQRDPLDRCWTFVK